MRMEKSLQYAITKAKKNIYNDKYSRIENVLDAMYQYYINRDEVETLMNSINKWIEKQHAEHNLILVKTYNQEEIDIIKRNA